MKLNARALGNACGLVSGFVILIFTIISMYTGYGENVTYMLTEIYPFYRLGLIGSIIGLLWGYVDGFVLGYIIGLLYNRFSD